MPDPRLTATPKDEVAALAAALNKTVIDFHRDRGLSPDLRVVCDASTLVMTTYMAQPDAWTSFQLMDRVIGMLPSGIRSSAEQEALDVTRGSKSS